MVPTIGGEGVDHHVRTIQSRASIVSFLNKIVPERKTTLTTSVRIEREMCSFIRRSIEPRVIWIPVQTGTVSTGLRTNLVNRGPRHWFSFLRAMGNQTKLSTFSTVAFRVRLVPDCFHASSWAPP